MADDKIVTDDEEEVIEEKKKDDSLTGEEESDEEDDKSKEEEEPIIPVRDATFQHIIARKNRKIEKLQQKKEDDESDDDNELSPEARSAVAREIDSRLAPLVKNEVNRETEILLGKLYQDEPEAKDFDKIIRKFVGYEKNGIRPYEHIPPEVIYHHLAFGTAEATGANKRKAADLESNLSRNRGRGMRKISTKTESGLPSIEEMENMSREEFTTKIINPSMQG